MIDLVGLLDESNARMSATSTRGAPPPRPPSRRQFSLLRFHPVGNDHGNDRSSGHLPEYLRSVGGPVHVVIVGGDGDFYPGVHPFRVPSPGAGDYQVQQEEFIALILGDGPVGLRALHLLVEVRVGPEARSLQYPGTPDARLLGPGCF